MSTEIERSVTLTIKSNEYVIEFPNVGNFQRIETMKQLLSKGMYSSLLSVATISSEKALSMIDVEAYLTVLAPNLVKDLKCDNFSELGIFDYKEIEDQYLEVFVPWWNNILEALSPKKDEE